MPPRKFIARLSYRVAIARNCLSLPEEGTRSLGEMQGDFNLCGEKLGNINHLDEISLLEEQGGYNPLAGRKRIRIRIAGRRSMNLTVNSIQHPLQLAGVCASDRRVASWLRAAVEGAQSSYGAAKQRPLAADHNTLLADMRFGVPAFSDPFILTA